jgi:hypothetical protein
MVRAVGSDMGDLGLGNALPTTRTMNLHPVWGGELEVETGGDASKTGG